MYRGSVENIQPSEDRQRYIDEARAYNAQLATSGHHAFPANEEAPGFDSYMNTLNAPETHGMIARILVPSIAVDLPVYHTTNPSVLYEGAGHMFGSDLPVGGPGTNSVISAHTGMVNASMFDRLPQLKQGEIAVVEVMGEMLYYRVTGSEVVGPFEHEAITYEEGKDKLTLVTCTPYGINTDRLLVELERTSPPATLLEDTGLTLSWWMKIVLVVLFLVITFVVVSEWRRRKRRRQAAPPVAAE